MPMRWGFSNLPIRSQPTEGPIGGAQRPWFARKAIASANGQIRSITPDVRSFGSKSHSSVSALEIRTRSSGRVAKREGTHNIIDSAELAVKLRHRIRFLENGP